MAIQISPDEPRGARLLRGALGALGLAAAVLIALPVVGALVPWLPVVGVLGSSFAGHMPFEFAVLGAVVLAVSLAARARVRPAARCGLVAGAITLVGALVVLSCQLSFSLGRGAEIGVGDVVRGGRPMPPPDRTETFAVVQGRPLRAGIWLPRGESPVPRPAVIWVHGGGFVEGSRDEQRGIYRYLADRGYPVISVDYRLAPPVRWRDATEDVVCAMSWLTGHAAEYGVDPARLVLAGGSAGGSLTLNVAYGLAAGSIASSCPGPAPAAPAAVAGFYPAADLAGVYRDNGMYGYARRSARAYLGGSPRQVPDRYAYASALARVRPGLMPTLLVTGGNDHLIFERRVREVADRLRAAGDPVRYDVFPFGDHAFDAAGIGNAFSRSVLLDFLHEHAPL